MRAPPARDLTYEARTLFILQTIVWGALALKALQEPHYGALIGFGVLAFANGWLAVQGKVHP